MVIGEGWRHSPSGSTPPEMANGPVDGPVALAIIGAGERGLAVYGAFALEHPDRARVVAVAEIDADRRARFGALHGLPEEAHFERWEDLLAAEVAFDGLIIATPDALHEEPAIAALRQDRHILLEKPVAPTEAGLRRVVTAARSSRGSVSVAHELRYAPFFGAVKAAITGGDLGRLIGIDLIENIGYWHFAHSYVRGNWRREDQSSPMILSKACHDLDILRWLVGSRPLRVTSTGDLRHFSPEHAPPGATERCTDGCPAAPTCPFDAVALYVQGIPGRWPVSAVTPSRDPAVVRAALESGPYGRCVYRSDNDVVDHQVALFEFSDGVSATLTASAFSAQVTRSIRVFGTRGELSGSLLDGSLTLRPFRPGPFDPAAGGVSAAAPMDMSVASEEGHGGGDALLLAGFVDDIRRRGSGDGPVSALTDLDASTDSHLMAFAAERSRHSGATVDIGTIA